MKRAEMSREELALELFRLGEIQFGEFELTMHLTSPGAPLSPIFFNLRTPPDGNLTSGSLSELGAHLRAVVEKEQIQFDCLAGIPKAGVPIARAVRGIRTSRYIIPLINLVRRDDVAGKKVFSLTPDQTIQPGSVALSVDNAVSGADTHIAAIAAMRPKLTVNDALVVVDREQGGKENLARIGVNLHSLYTMGWLLDFYVAQGRITPEMVEEVRTYKARCDAYFTSLK